MADLPTHEPRETKTLQFARFIVRNRFPVALALIAVSLFFFYPIFNLAMTAAGIPLPGPTVRIDTNARDLFPDHPYIHAQDKFAKRFGSSSLVAIAVTVKEGTIFTPEVIAKIHEITDPTKKDAYVFLGNTLEHPRSFMVVGFYYPTKRKKGPERPSDPQIRLPGIS